MAAVPTTEARVWFAPDRDEDGFLPEGPREVVVDGEPAVAWVNIQTAADASAGAVHVRFWGDAEDHFHLNAPGPPGFLLPTVREGVILVGLGKEVVPCDLSSAEWFEPRATIPDVSPRTIINDGEVVPGGRAVVFGTKDVRFEDPIAHLYLYTLDDDRITVLADGQLCSNGKVFAREGGGLVLYDIDTPRKVVGRYRLDLRKRALTEDGVALDLGGVGAFPDGMVDCGDGTVIVAFYDPGDVPAGRARRYRLGTGELLAEWTTPGSPRVTCPLLVERDGGVKLLLTTAVEGMTAELRQRCPNAGSLFLADTELDRVPVPEVVRLG